MPIIDDILCVLEGLIKTLKLGGNSKKNQNLKKICRDKQENLREMSQGNTRPLVSGKLSAEDCSCVVLVGSVRA